MLQQNKVECLPPSPILSLYDIVSMAVAYFLAHLTRLEMVARDKQFSLWREHFVQWTPGACIIKLITAVIHSVTWKASVFVKASKKWLTIAKAMAYCTMELLMATKSFMIQGPLGA